MYRNTSPEDNTAVIKMVKGFYRFLEKPPASNLKENKEFNLPGKSNLFGDCSSHKPFNFLDTNKSCNSSGVGDHNKSNKQTSFGSMLDDNPSRKRRSMTTLSVDEKAELIASKSKAAKLEVQLKSVDYERRRSDIDGDKKRKLQANKFAKDQEEIDVLRRKYKQLVEQKQAAVDDLAAFEKSHNDLKSELNYKIDELQRENLHVKNCLDELQCGIDSEFDELKEKHRRMNLEFAMCKQRLEEADTQLTLGRSRIEESKEMVSDFTELQSRCVLAEGNAKFLEQKLLEKEETYLVVQKSQKQLANYLQLEKENKALREDNALYRDSASNILILEEKLSNLTPKLAAAEVLKEKVEQLEYENEQLLNKLKKWEAPDASGLNVKSRSPSDLTRIIGDLQETQLDLSASKTQWETRACLTDTMLESKQEECIELLRQFRDLTAQNEQLEDKTQKLQRRLTLLTTERDGLRHVLSSYEKEEGTAIKIHMQQVDEKVAQYNQQMKVLEDDLASARMEAMSEKTKYLELKQEHERLKASQHSSTDNIKTMVEDRTIKEKYEELKVKYEKMNEEKEILELRIEKREMQGDYDPFKMKVLHLKSNPFQMARESHQKKLKDIFEENERMRKKIIKLQTARNEELEESMNVSKLIKSSKPMEEATKQIQEWKLKYKRLEEEYGKSAKRFIIAVKNLLGYSLKEDKVNTYRLQSIYSENPDNFFIFQCSQTKGVINTGVVETAFTRQWLGLFNEYVRGRDSIPSFLAAVNLELFNQTD